MAEGLVVYLAVMQLSAVAHWRFTPTCPTTRALLEEATLRRTHLRGPDGDVLALSQESRAIAEYLRARDVEVIDRQSVMRRRADNAKGTNREDAD